MTAHAPTLTDAPIALRATTIPTLLATITHAPTLAATTIRPAITTQMQDAITTTASSSSTAQEPAGAPSSKMPAETASTRISRLKKHFLSTSQAQNKLGSYLTTSPKFK